MTTVSIPLSDERLSKLRELAAETGLAPEEFLRQRVESWLERPDAAFAESAAYVLKKNAELYKRLA